MEVMMAQLGHMDRETSLEYVHIQQRALERAQQLIESEQREILAAAEGRKRKTKTHRHTAIEVVKADRTRSTSKPRRRSVRTICR